MSKVTFEIQQQDAIQSVQSFLFSLSEVRKSCKDKKLWYRGHSDATYELLPSIGRRQKYVGKEVELTSKEEEQLLHRFRRRAYPLVGRELTAGEALFVARHHGLPTRLLDWTANALVALYFACSEHHKIDGAYWAMLRRIGAQDVDAFELARTVDEKSLFSFRFGRTAAQNVNEHISDGYAIKLIHPFYNSPRLLAQDGAFTWHTSPWKKMESLAGMDFDERNLDFERLYSWPIPKDAKVPIVKELSALGITHRMVYPDLDGIAQSLVETEVLWND